LQLKDGETQILGGLLQHKSDQSQTKIPGVGDVPLLGRLFGTARDVWDKTELLLAITPHVIRNVPSGEADLVEMWSGTESHLKFGAQNLKISAGGAVSAQGSAATAAPAAAAPAAAAPAPAARSAAAAAAAPLSALVQAPTQAKVGDKFTATVMLQGGVALTNASSSISYDGKVLKALSVTEGDLFSRTQAKGKFEGVVDEKGESVNISLVAENGSTPAGGGRLAQISFEVIGSGNAALGVSALSASSVAGTSVPGTAAPAIQVAVP
jgi:general secretion pathway protein D